MEHKRGAPGTTSLRLSFITSRPTIASLTGPQAHSRIAVQLASRHAAVTRRSQTKIGLVCAQVVKPATQLLIRSILSSCTEVQLHVATLLRARRKTFLRN